MEKLGPIDPIKHSQSTSSNVAFCGSNASDATDLFGRERIAEINLPTRESDLEFLKSLPLRTVLTVEEYERSVEISEKYYHVTLDDLPETRLIYDILVQYSKDDHLLELFDRTQERIANEAYEFKKAIEFFEDFSRDIVVDDRYEELLQIWEDISLEKYSTNPTASALKLKITDLINSQIFKDVIHIRLTNGSFEFKLALLSILKKLSFKETADDSFKKELESLFLQEKLVIESAKLQFEEDLAFLENLNWVSCTFLDLEKLVTISSNCSNGCYTQEYCNHLLKFILEKFVSIQQRPAYKENLSLILKEQHPIESIKLLQNLRNLAAKNCLFSHIETMYHAFESKCAEKLFTQKEEAAGVSQVNFFDETLSIKSGGANYCCGSMSVAAIVDKMAESRRTIEDLLKEGVTRHLKLHADQMTRLTSVAKLLEGNPDIIQKEETIFESPLVNSIRIDKYEQFLNRIELGSIGLLLAGNAFIMYAKNLDGTVEIFDSHGCSIPFIVGYTQPAYRAFFKSTSDAAAYLSVHRNIMPNDELSFYSLGIKIS